MKKISKILAMVLALTMLFTLAACGKSENKPEATPAPETVYASEFKTFPGTYSGTNARLNVRYTDETGFYGMINEVVGQREPYEGEVAEWEGQFDVYEPRLYHMDMEGKLTKLAYEPLKLDDVREDAEVSNWIESLQKTKDGFLVIEEVFVNWSDAPEGVEPYSDEWYNYSQNEDRYYIRYLDQNGAELKCAQMDLEELNQNGEPVNLYRIAVLDDGTLLTAGETALYLFDENGKYGGKIEGSFEWIMNLLQLPDGVVYVVGYGQNTSGGYQASLMPVDVQNRSFGEALEVEGDLYSAIPGGGKYLFYYNNGNNFYGYDAEKQESVKLFNWINVNVLSDDLDNFTVLPDGSVVGLMSEWDKNYENATRSLVTIREVPYASLPEKTVLTLASDGMDWNFQRELVRFNRTSETTRIELVDYSEYDNYDTDYDENGYGEPGGMTKLRTEILSGKVPDILDLNGMPTRQLAAKGLLMDLYPLLDADPELSREDIFPNVLKALETDGKLTSVSSGFYIETCIGAKSVVGDTPGWTYQELNAALASMPEGCTVFGISTTRDGVLNTMLSLDMGQFVDWSTGKVSFDSEDFVALLTFVKEFPAEFDWSKHEWAEEDEDFNRIKAGKQMLLNYGMSGLEDLGAYDSIFGGPDSYTFIGYPTTEGVGNLLRVNSGFAISRDCKDPEAAWQFLRVLLTEKYEDERGYNFPANANLFEKRKQEAMTPIYQKDADGHILIDPETGEKMMEAKGWTIDFETMEETPIYVYTQEQVDKVEAVILATDRVPDNNKPILDIVREQAQAFFAGQRTAEEVAKLVQSKVNIYVNEQR